MSPKVKRSKKIKRTTTMAFTFPDDVAQALKTKKNKSQYLASLVRADLEKQATTPPLTPEQIAEEKKKLDLQEEIAGGMTREEILTRIKAQRDNDFRKKMKDYERKIKDAKKKDDYATANILRRNQIEDMNEFWDMNVVTMKQIQAALGLPYMTIYNKILPVLRAEGFKIKTE